MNFGGSDWRQRRNLLNKGIPFNPMHYTMSNYSTDVQIDKKIQIDDMKSPLAEDVLNRFHSIPDPLKKNLADSVITAEDKNKKINKMSLDMKDFCYESDIHAEEAFRVPGNRRSDFYPSLTGIAGFFTNVFGAISGAMFHRRPKSPTSQYYDCFDQVSADRHEGSPRAWQMSKNQDQNKNGRAQEQFSAPNDNMNNCRSAVAQCEDKLNAVRSLLTSKSVPIPPKTQTRLRRPRKRFVEPGSVEDSFEDAFSPEDFVSLANEEYIEHFSIHNSQKQELCEVEAPKMKTEVAPLECTEIVKCLPEINSEKSPEISKEIKQCTDNIKDSTEKIPETLDSNVNIVNSSIDYKEDNKQEIISSCEDKMARLKSLLQEKRKKTTRKTDLSSSDSAIEPLQEAIVTERLKPTTTKTIPSDKKQDKRFKNPHRLSKDKRKKSKQRKNIQEDMSFAHEIDSENLSSVENSPKYISSLHRLCKETKKVTTDPIALRKDSQIGSLEEKEYFDEVKGRFHSSSTTESEDSFQIVFTDSPKLSRKHRPSDCESEDSFIVFEDSPDSCYTSNDVFGNQTDDSECESDSDSDISDSGCAEVCILSHSFSRTVSDLTDDSLYDEDGTHGRKLDRLDSDEVDCAVTTVCEEIPAQEVKDFSELEEIESLHDEPAKNQGLLLDEARKRKKKDQPAKRVSFTADPPKVHVLRVWTFAARQARAGHWERHALDRERFKRRIADVDMAVAWVLKPQHRSRVMFQRFMPWWNAQRRQELAEKKQREAEKIQKEEEEKLRTEAEREGNSADTIADAECKGIDELAVNEKSEILNTVCKENVEIAVDESRGNISDTAKVKKIKNGEIKQILDTNKIENRNGKGAETNKEQRNVEFKNIQKYIIPNDKLVDTEVDLNLHNV